MITRRACLGVIGAVACGARAAFADLTVPPGDRLAFRVLRNDSEIGTHILRFTRTADGLDIAIAVELRVGLGPITLFRYNMSGIERWRGGQIEQLDMATNDDGTHDFARATRDATGLWVEGSKAPRYRAPSSALPATHWNEAELNGPWINPQDGKLLRPEVARRGADSVSDMAGQALAARRYALSGDVQMDLWYDATPTWIALRAPAHDGSIIRYERM